MSSLRGDLKLVRLMLAEELRLNAGMIGRVQFLMFPLMIFIFSLILAIASPHLLRSTSVGQVYAVLYVLIFAYGLSVGGFALFGEAIASRRFGQVTMLLQTPTLLPVTFRKLFAVFYVKDVIYYLGYTIIPLIAGLAASIPVTGFRAASVLFLLLTATLSFLLGISFSFFLSSVYVRSRAALAALLGTMATVLAVGYLGRYFDLAQLLPSLTLQRGGGPLSLLLSLALILLFSAVALLTLQVKFGKASALYDQEVLSTEQKFRFARANGRLMAKDWIDLRRSGTLAPVAGAYIGPLLFMAALFWFVDGFLQVRLPINLVFYAAMIGFFSVSIYGWLNLLDTPGYLEVLPVRVSEVIRAKLVMLSLFAVAMSTIFLAALAVLRNELSVLPIALLVGYSSTAFTVSGTAYLTGLRTNSYLFDPGILAKFAGMCIPPLIALVILSFSYPGDPALVGALIAALCLALLLASVLMYRRIDGRWGRASFSFEPSGPRAHRRLRL